MKLVYDYDWVLFKACCAAEHRFVKVTVLKSGEEHIFKNRTEVYGNWRTKNSAWLAEQNLDISDIVIEDQVEAEPLSNALQIIKNIIKEVNSRFSTESYYGYVSGDGNYRKDLCTLLPYKGQRETFISPVHLKEAKKYLIENHHAKTSGYYESDDCLVMDMYSTLQQDEILIGVVNEKDYRGCDGNWYLYDAQELLNVDGLGSLYRDSKGNVKGTGRLFKYFQVCWQDTADNYAANCFSDSKNGQVLVYNLLKDCKTDKEAFEAMVKHFMYLYPEEKVVEGCKGLIPIDWFYVMQEQFNMAHLLRYEGDRIKVNDVLNKLGVTT